MTTQLLMRELAQERYEKLRKALGGKVNMIRYQEVTFRNGEERYQIYISDVAMGRVTIECGKNGWETKFDFEKETDLYLQAVIENVMR